MSSTDTRQFLAETLSQAAKVPLECHVLAQGEGLVLFSCHITPTQKLHNLQQLLNTLTKDNRAETPSTPSASSPDQCQVTVEERAQLFAFLQGTP